MKTATMCGVFPILVTPFDENRRVDEESLRRLIEFNLDAGVHGLGVVLGSEIFKLSEAERDQVTRLVVDQVRGRVPVINTGAPGTDLALFYSRRAEELGADALMILPAHPPLCRPAPARSTPIFKRFPTWRIPDLFTRYANRFDHGFSASDRRKLCLGRGISR